MLSFLFRRKALKLVDREKVSILMPSFNSEDYLDQAITSVVNQTYGNWELLICDDSSSDNSFIIAKKWASRDSRIRVLKNIKTKGAAGARNTSLQVAQGRYIAFLDSDDFWHKDKLQIQIKHMESTGSPFSFTYYNVIDETGSFLHTIKTPSKLTLKHLSVSNFIPCLTVVYDSLRFGKVQQPDIEKRNDFALWLTIFSRGDFTSGSCVKKSLATYRQNSYGLSSGKKDALKYFVICLVRYRKHSLFLSVFLSGFYLFIVFMKKKFPKLYNWAVIKI